MDSILNPFNDSISPYYTAKHHEYRCHVRNFRRKYIDPNIASWIANDKHPNVREHIATMIDYGGLYLFPYGFAEWKGYKWDPFYLIIFEEEMSCHCWGSAENIICLSLVPLQRFATNNLHKKVLNEIKTGKKLISFAISELAAGSDLVNIKTTAELTDDKQYYIVNGNKYWITAGDRADYFMTLCRTNKKLKYGLSLLLIPRYPVQGKVITTPIKMQGMPQTETAQVTFVNCKVPKTHLIHKENYGFIPLVTNLNRERFMVATVSYCYSRMCVLEILLFMKKNKKKFDQHKVVKYRTAKMIMKVLSAKSFLERCAYQMKYDKYGESDTSLVINIALCKVQCSQTLQFCVNEANDIFGYFNVKINEKIDRIYRVVRAIAIGGGSEEIMLDLACKQAKL